MLNTRVLVAEASKAMRLPGKSAALFDVPDILSSTFRGIVFDASRSLKKPPSPDSVTPSITQLAKYFLKVENSPLNQSKLSAAMQSVVKAAPQWIKDKNISDSDQELWVIDYFVSYMMAEHAEYKIEDLGIQGSVTDICEKLSSLVSSSSAPLERLAYAALAVVLVKLNYFKAEVEELARKYENMPVVRSSAYQASSILEQEDNSYSERYAEYIIHFIQIRFRLYQRELSSSPALATHIAKLKDILLTETTSSAVVRLYRFKNALHELGNKIKNNIRECFGEENPQNRERSFFEFENAIALIIDCPTLHCKEALVNSNSSLVESGLAHLFNPTSEPVANVFFENLMAWHVTTKDYQDKYETYSIYNEYASADPEEEIYATEFAVPLSDYLKKNIKDQYAHKNTNRVELLSIKNVNQMSKAFESFSTVYLLQDDEVMQVLQQALVDVISEIKREHDFKRLEAYYKSSNNLAASAHFLENLTKNENSADAAAEHTILFLKRICAKYRAFLDANDFSDVLGYPKEMPWYTVLFDRDIPVVDRLSVFEQRLMVFAEAYGSSHSVDIASLSSGRSSRSLSNEGGEFIAEINHCLNDIPDYCAKVHRDENQEHVSTPDSPPAKTEETTIELAIKYLNNKKEREAIGKTLKARFSEILRSDKIAELELDSADDATETFVGIFRNEITKTICLPPLFNDLSDIGVIFYEMVEDEESAPLAYAATALGIALDLANKKRQVYELIDLYQKILPPNDSVKYSLSILTNVGTKFYEERLAQYQLVFIKEMITKFVKALNKIPGVEAPYYNKFLKEIVLDLFISNDNSVGKITGIRKSIKRFETELNKNPNKIRTRVNKGTNQLLQELQDILDQPAVKVRTISFPVVETVPDVLKPYAPRPHVPPRPRITATVLVV